MTTEERTTFHPEMTDEEYALWFTSRPGYIVRMISSDAFSFNRAWATRLHDASTFELPYSAMKTLVERGAVIRIGDCYIA